MYKFRWIYPVERYPSNRAFRLLTGFTIRGETMSTAQARVEPNQQIVTARKTAASAGMALVFTIVIFVTVLVYVPAFYAPLLVGATVCLQAWVFLTAHYRCVELLAKR